MIAAKRGSAGRWAWGVVIVLTLMLCARAVCLAQSGHMVELVVGLTRGEGPPQWPDYVHGVRHIPGSRLYRVWVEQEDVDQALLEIKALDGVRFVEQAGVGQPETGQFEGGRVYQWQDAINASVLPRLSGGQGVVVALIDTGLDLQNGVLAKVLWQNVGETPGDGLDNDHNGYVDDLHGWDFGDNDNDPQDEFGHGTEVGSIIAELASGSELLPLKIDSGGDDTFSSGAVAEAIYYAIGAGAKVINMSLVFSEPCQAVTEAIRDARQAGALVVAAAGNHGYPVRYPASLPEVVAVGSVDINNELSPFSGWGEDLDLTAPGEVIETIGLGGEVVYGYGTSFSCAMVSAVAAVIRAMNPHLAPDTVRYLLTSGARDLGQPGPDEFYGAGMLDCARLWGVSTPRILPSNYPFSIFSQNECAEISYYLPPTDTEVNVFVGLMGTSGVMWLDTAGNWHDLAAEPIESVAHGRLDGEGVEGILFGDQGAFPAIDLSLLSKGKFWWAIAITDEQGTLLGPINWAGMIVI